MRGSIILGSLALATCLLAGCTVKESGDKENKRVDIQTPMGSMNVKENDAADPKATGMTEYPGAVQVAEGDHGDDKSANIDMSFGGFGLKVAAANYRSDDPQSKVMDFYKKDLAKYGKVLVCDPQARRDTPPPDKDSDTLTCSDKSGVHAQVSNSADSDDTVIKAGTQHRQHIVAFKPSSKGTKFALVYVEIRGVDQHTM